MLPKCNSPLVFIARSSDVFKLLILEGFLTCQSDCTLHVCPASLSHRCGEEGPRVQEEWLCPPYSLTLAFEVSTAGCHIHTPLSSESQDLPAATWQSSWQLWRVGGHMFQCGVLQKQSTSDLGVWSGVLKWVYTVISHFSIVQMIVEWYLGHCRENGSDVTFPFSNTLDCGDSWKDIIKCQR